MENRFFFIRRNGWRIEFEMSQSYKSSGIKYAAYQTYSVCYVDCMTKEMKRSFAACVEDVLHEQIDAATLPESKRTYGFI